MSLYQKASLVQIPSGYKAADDKLYSVVPSNGNGDFTIDSDADATRVNKDGLIESVVADQARLNYDFTNPQDPHLLLEPSRTQLAGYPTAITSANGYGLTNGTLTANDSTAPDGSLTASTFEATSALGQFQKVKGGSSGVEYSVSVYVKRKTGTGTVYLRAVENTNTAVTVTDEWTRVSATVTSTSTNVRFGMALGTSGDEIYVWGFQVEAGSYPTSFIPNADNSEVTRTEDFCNIPSGLGNVLNTSEGTLFVDVEVPRVSSTGSYERIVLSDQNASTDRIFIDNYGGNWRAFMISTGGTVANYNIRSVQANTRIKIALAYSSTELRVSYDGNAVTTTSGSYTPSTTLESFKFSNKDGGNKWQGKIHQAMYFDTALTNAELQTLTS